MPALEVDGRPLFFLGGPSGVEGRPPLVLVHGAGGSVAMWTRLHADLRTEWPIYALDLPGHGRSAPLAGPTGVGEYAATLRAFLDAAGLPRAVLVGHSMGGAVAQQLALEAPGRVRGLVLVGTGARLRVSREILEGIQKDVDATVERICRLCYAPGTPPDLLERGIAEMRKVAPAVLLDDFRACDAFDLRERVAAITAPTLVLIGDRDVMTPPKYAAFLADRIPGARFVSVPGAGHMLPVEAPAAVVAALRPFIAPL